MNITKRTILLTAALTVAAGVTLAQPAERPQRPAGPRGERPPGAAAGRPEAGRPNPFFGLFDADQDGIIAADEIARASEVLKRLDRNQDGKITPEEFRPQPREIRTQERGIRRGGAAQQPSTDRPPRETRPNAGRRRVPATE